MEATESAPGASALIRLGEAREDGNWTLELETAGLPELPPGGYYVLWLAQGRRVRGNVRDLPDGRRRDRGADERVLPARGVRRVGRHGRAAR